MEAAPFRSLRSRATRDGFPRLSRVAHFVLGEAAPADGARRLPPCAPRRYTARWVSAASDSTAPGSGVALIG
jgi:hypothetical protein